MRILLRDAALTAAEERRLRQVAARLRRCFGRVAELEWRFSVEGRQRVARCRLRARGAEYQARAESARFGSSIDGAVDTLLRQRRRRVAKEHSARRRVR